MADDFDLVIVGMGSGGMVAAEFAATLGLRVAIAERGRVGGDCLWTGCVPSKALLASGKIAHHMRHADEWGITPAPPSVDRARYGIGSGLPSVRRRHRRQPRALPQHGCRDCRP